MPIKVTAEIANGLMELKRKRAELENARTQARIAEEHFKTVSAQEDEIEKAVLAKIGGDALQVLIEEHGTVFEVVKHKPGHGVDRIATREILRYGK